MEHTFTSLKLPVIFAHRGASAQAPENTLAAFKLAAEQGGPAIELDAKLSADGEVMVMHDATVDRTTDGSGRVGSLTLAELKKLDAGAKFNIQYKGEPIPTLGEVFEQVGKQLVINVELTNYASPLDHLPDKVVELVKKFGLESSVMFSSFNLIALIRARALMPSMPLGFLTERGFASVVLKSRLVPINAKLFLHPEHNDASPKLIDTVHRRGSRVNVYTVNDAAQMQKLFQAGVDGVFTDDPLLARKVLAAVKP